MRTTVMVGKIGPAFQHNEIQSWDRAFGENVSIGLLIEATRQSIIDAQQIYDIPNPEHYGEICGMDLVTLFTFFTCPQCGEPLIPAADFNSEYCDHCDW